MKKENLKILNDFSNDHVLATHIKVEISDYNKSFKPRQSNGAAKYEDANLLSSIICGAENLVYYLERNGYKIIKVKK
jgi:hypothetical protein